MRSIPDRTVLLCGWIILLLVTTLPLLLGRVLVYGDLSGYFPGLIQAWRHAEGWQSFLWASDIASGYPTLANPQLNPLYPFTWIFSLPGGPVQVLTVTVCIHLLIGGTGALFWAVRRRMPPWIAVFFAFLFVFQGVIVSMVSVLENLQVLVWVPWIAWAFLRCREWRHAALLLVFCQLATGAGDPQAILLVGLAGLPWFLFEGRASLVLIACAALSVVLQPWLLPFLEGITALDRAAGIQSLTDRAWGLDGQLVATSLFPTSLQRPEDGGAWIEGLVRQNWLQSLYVGILPAVFGWKGIHGRRRTWIVFGAVQAILILLSIKGIPAIDRFREGVPLLSMIRFPSRFVIMIPIVVLFLFGELFREKSFRIFSLSARVQIWSVVGFVVFGFLGISGSAVMREAAEPAFSRWTGSLLLDLGGAALALGVGLLAISRRSKAILYVALLIEVLLGFRAAVLVSPVAPSRAFLSLAEFDRMGIPQGRWITLPATWNMASWRGIPKRAGTRMPKLPPQRNVKIIDIPGLSPKFGFDLAAFRPSWSMPIVLRTARSASAGSMLHLDSVQFAENILWHAGVTYSLVILERDGSLVSPYLSHPGTMIAIVRTPSEVLVASRHEGISRMHLFQKVDTSTDWATIFRRDPVVDPVARIGAVPCKIGEESDSVTRPLRWERKSSVEYVADVEGRKGVLVLAQDRYPGWSARIDGRVVKPIVVNWLQMGVCLDGSSKRVEFHYKPWWLWWIPIQMGMGILLAFGLCEVLRRWSLLEHSRLGGE